jgi:T4-like virus tail tube protein gp19
MADARVSRAGAFALELEGAIVGYIKKADLGKLKGEIVTSNLGPTNRQRKHVAKMSWDTMSFEVGIAMGKELVDWMNAAFELNKLRKSGAFIMFDHNYQVQQRCEFTNAHIAEIALPVFDAKGKESVYFSIKIQPETVRFSDSGGRMKPTVQREKVFLNSSFRVDAAGLPAKLTSKVDSLKWTYRPTESTAALIDSQYEPTAVEVGDLKLTIGAQDFKPWYEAADAFLISGKNADEDERKFGIDVLDPAAKPVARIDFENCGFKEFAFPVMATKADEISQFAVTMYCEQVKLTINKIDS